MAPRLRACFFVLALGACGSSSNAPQEGTLYASCTNIDASAPCSDDAATFEVLQPILEKSCLPACHDGSPDASWPLTDYDDVKAWTSFVAHDVLRCTMPPLDSASRYPISRQDREKILQWITCGTPP